MKNPYGLNKAGDFVFVDEVERGLACDCICPLCHKIFRACQGETNQHYFAHQDASECEFSYRASLLRMVVDYLRSGELEIPAVIARYMHESEVLQAGESIVFDRIEQHGDIQTPELRCYLGEREWVLKPVFDKKRGLDQAYSGTHLILDLTQFSNPYISRPHQTLKPTLQKQRLLSWKNYPGLEAREQELEQEHLEKLAEQKDSTARQYHAARLTRPYTPKPKPTFQFREIPLPCKFCKKEIQPLDYAVANKSQGFCVCRACNKERGGDIW